MDKPVDSMFFDFDYHRIFTNRWIAENGEKYTYQYQCRDSGKIRNHMPLNDITLLETIRNMYALHRSTFNSLIVNVHSQRDEVLRGYENYLSRDNRQYMRIDGKIVNEIFDKFVMDFTEHYLKIYKVFNNQNEVKQIHSDLDFHESSLIELKTRVENTLSSEIKELKMDNEEFKSMNSVLFRQLNKIKCENKKLKIDNEEFKSIISALFEEVNNLKLHNQCLSDRINVLEK